MSDSKAVSKRMGKAHSQQRGVMPPGDDLQISPERAAMLRKSILLHEYGTPQEQKDALVAEILGTFSQPDNWPLTDADRIALLKKWYHKAETIRRTEAA